MYNTVIAVLEKNSGTWKEMPAFSRAYEAFKGTVGKINTVRTVQAGNKGVAMDKAAIKAALAEKALQVGGAIQAYADSSDNQTLREAVSFTLSELMKSRDGVMSDRSKLVHDKAKLHATALAEYGITKTDILALKAMLDRFNALIVEPRKVISESKTATREIEALMKEASKLLKNRLDKMMLKFKAGAADFYSTYRNARIIIDKGIRHEEDDEAVE